MPESEPTNVVKAHHFPAIDLLRGIAIALVFAYHALGATFGTDHLGWKGDWIDFSSGPGLSFLLVYPLAFGWTGVALFFVISGFCIHYSHQRSRTKTWHEFTLRRVYRIVPPYLLWLLIFVALGVGKAGEARDPGQVLSHIFLVHNATADWYGGINPSFWSIAIEAQLYLLYPLLMLFAVRLGWANALRIVCVTELAIRLLGPLVHLPPLAYRLPVAFWFSWAIGAWLAEQVLRKEPLTLARQPLWLWVGVFLLTTHYHPLRTLYFFAASMVSAVILARMLSRPAGPTGRFHAWMRDAGAASYSIYLLHQPLLFLVGAWVPSQWDIHPLLRLGLLLLAWLPAVLLGSLSYRTVEAMSLRWCQRRLAHCFPTHYRDRAPG